MGKKVNPNILRISNILRTWDSKWFSDRRPKYKEQLGQDIKIRSYIDDKLRSASVSKMEIVRNQKEVVLTIHSSRPAVVIGRGGSGIEAIQKDLLRIIGTKTRVRINVQEVRNPDTDAVAVATQIVDQLERRMPFRRVLKWSLARPMQAGALGVRIAMAGRLNGAEIARTEWLSEGSVPLQTFRADISFAKATARTTYGAIGVKVWINRGDLIDNNQKDNKENKEQAQVKNVGRRRKSLADKAIKQKT